MVSTVKHGSKLRKSRKAELTIPTKSMTNSEYLRQPVGNKKVKST